MSVALFFGNGSWLIAGFNTSSEEEKASFDEKKLCKAAGVLCAIVAALLCVMAFLGYKVETGTMPENDMIPFAIVFLIAVFSALILIIWYMNTRCKK